MSNATLAAYGRLGSDPREHATRKGGMMATASLAVDVPNRSREAQDGHTETLWLKVVAFGRLGESLAGHSKGDPVSVSGRLQFSRFQSRDGEQREQWEIIADALVSARTAPPRGAWGKGAGNGRDRDDVGRRGDDAGGRMWPAAGRPAAARQSPPDDFDDDIPF